MSDRDNTLYIVDILIAINKIKRYTEKINSADELLHSELTWDAVIRELQIIGDASSKLLKYNIIDNEYRRIVDFRNIIVHGYFGIDHEIVWDIISSKLKNYNTDLSNIIKKKNINLKDAIDSAIIENSFNENIIKFLKGL